VLLILRGIKYLTRNLLVALLLTLTRLISVLGYRRWDDQSRHRSESFLERKWCRWIHKRISICLN